MFVPDEFTVPREHGNDQLHLKILSPSYAHKDYEAVMETQERLRKFSRHGWPREGFTIDENITDLERHEREFDNREAFAYTVVTPDGSRVLGCIYINPGHTNSEDADHGYQNPISGNPGQHLRMRTRSRQRCLV